MTDTLRISGAQLDLVVGDIEGNSSRIADAMRWAEGQDADVLLLPELAVTGYPPEDLLLRAGFVDENLQAVRSLAREAGRTVTIVGFADPVDTPSDVLDDAVVRVVANAAAILCEGKIKGVYHKVLLPNYAVFDEDRYFLRGLDPDQVWLVSGIPVGVSICEDIWVLEGPPAHQADAGARILLNINASPYHMDKAEERASLLSAQAVRSGVPVAYMNMVGGQDELVFEGDSMIFAADGDLLYRAAEFEEERFVVDVPLPPPKTINGRLVEVRGGKLPKRTPRQPPVSPARIEPEEAEIYAALMTGLRDYVHKNGFQNVVLGLSGGIDSALVAAIAADALGPEHVRGVAMPTRFSSEGSVIDARDLAERLGIRIDLIAIDDIFSAYLDALGPVFEGTEFGVAEENLQARIRGAIVMGISNKFGEMVVATGNKSEMAVGYATLYGDMAGGFAVLKDVLKTLVYRLAEWRNRDREVIPRSIITKAPSAELRPDQKDTDSLPPYEILDPILERYVEQDLSIEEIVGDGFDRDIVVRIARMVDCNEYKRRQAAPGVRITRKAFGKDRRLPITNRYRRC
ncbi:MAG TPA: NAD+ synthase [Actinobacteria bacterium]|nr:glutamine-dependent NAD(+) synthetase [bacterium BMS3Bbin01]HDH25571.1 NAD+ synthase [Actinomycetota bacterium]